MSHQQTKKERIRPLLVTQVDFADMTGMEPVDLYILIQDGKIPVVEHDGAHLINLSDIRAKCWLREQRKELF